MAPTAFATSEPLEPSELEAAPVRYPRPSRLRAALTLDGAKAQRAAETLGLETVGDLLLHLPRDRREARAVAELVPGDSATVVVQVRSISSRSVRRRGMRPLVEATVADESGAMKATFFNQPWLEQRYPVGTRLALHGKFEGPAGRLPRSGARADRRRGRRRATRPWRTTRPPRACPRPRSSRWCASIASALADVVEPLPAACAGAGAAARPLGGADRGAFRRPPKRRLELGAPPAGLRRAAAGPARAAAAPAPAPRRRASAPVLDRRARADRAVAGDDAAVHADRRSDARAGGGRRATWPSRSRCSGC